MFLADATVEKSESCLSPWSYCRYELLFLSKVGLSFKKVKLSFILQQKFSKKEQEESLKKNLDLCSRTFRL